MNNDKNEELLLTIFNTWDLFAAPKEGEHNLTVPELAKRMEAHRTTFKGSRDKPHEFADDVL